MDYDTQDYSQGMTDEDRRAEVYRQLLQKMQNQSQFNQAAPMAQANAGLTTAIGKAAAQAGSFGGGKMADTSSLDQSLGNFTQGVKEMGSDTSDMGMREKLYANLNDKILKRDTLAQTREDKATKLAADTEDKATKASQFKQKLDQDESQFTRKQAQDRDLKDREKPSKLDLPYAERVAALNSSDKNRFDNARLGLTSVNNMLTHLRSGGDRYKIIGSNKFTQNMDMAAEAFGRMQSGGAINKDEEARFISMLRNPLDSREQTEQKLLQFQQEMASRMSTLGFNPSEINDPGLKRSSEEFSKSRPLIQSGTATAAPAPAMPIPESIDLSAHGFTVDDAKRKAELQAKIDARAKQNGGSP